MAEGRKMSKDFSRRNNQKMRDENKRKVRTKKIKVERKTEKTKEK
jgi:hypothetical protein